MRALLVIFALLTVLALLFFWALSSRPDPVSFIDDDPGLTPALWVTGDLHKALRSCYLTPGGCP